ncbi:TPA: hypothetical protein QDB06_000808 [Burkholderia vietnamiensis]|nr:hypothetical protein [Burkholderia vietnamiensis]
MLEHEKIEKPVFNINSFKFFEAKISTTSQQFDFQKPNAPVLIAREPAITPTMTRPFSPWKLLKRAGTISLTVLIVIVKIFFLSLAKIAFGGSHLNYRDENEKEVFDFIRKNPNVFQADEWGNLKFKDQAYRDRKIEEAMAKVRELNIKTDE